MTSAAGRGVEELSVSVLGSVRASRGGAPCPIGSRRQRALLAALAVRHPRAVAVDELVDAVWGDDPPERARTTLQTYVSRLRSVLGEAAIHHGPAGYRLAADVAVDADRARAAVADAEAALGRDPVRSVALAEAALSLWNGPALAELAPTPWFEPLAVGLDEVRGQLEEVLAEALVASGRAGAAVPHLEMAVRTHPFRERGQLLLARALAERGRSADALRSLDRYRSRLRDETGLDPGPAVTDLEQAILAGVDSAPAEPAPHPHRPLPRPTRLIGRHAELDQLREHLRRNRLVTVLGPGGIGKTRLVAELLATRTDRDPPDVVVELARVEPVSAVDAIAAALGYRAGPADTSTLVDVLGSDTTLVVLDSCEHLVPEVRAAVRIVLDACPDVRFVATSQVRLGLPDEQVAGLGPLDTGGASSPAADLFVDCLGRSRPELDVDPSREDVRRICQRVDGVPFAVQLAAGRAALLGVETVTERLATSFDLLTLPAAVGADRHASITAVVTASHDLLDPTAQRLLAVLSTIAGELDLAAAERVGGEVLDDDVGPVFGRLVDASMVALGSRPGQFRLLDMVRDFGLRRLGAGDDEEAARRAHLRWVAGEVQAIGEQAVGPAESLVTAALDARRADVRAAIVWAADHDEDAGLAAVAEAVAGPFLYRPDAELAGLVLDVARRRIAADRSLDAALAAAASRAGFLLGALDDAAALARHALEVAPGGMLGAAPRSRAHHTLGVLGLYRGRFDLAGEEFAAVAAEPAASPIDRVDALAGSALAACYGRAPAAGLAAEHRALATALGSATSLAFADYIDGERALAAGDGARAIECLRAAATKAWAVEATFVWGLASTVLAATLVRTGEHADAVRQLPELLRRWRRTATWPQLWTSLRLVAEVLAGYGQGATAATLLAAAAADPSAPEPSPSDRERTGQLRRRLAGSLSRDELQAAEAVGRELDRRQLLDTAIAALDGLSDGERGR